MASHAVHGSDPAMPYRIACLCDLRDAQGRVLLLHRRKNPNKDMYSPIGGKLDVVSGESPAQCARREILEEAGIDVPLSRLHLIGLVSETAYEGHGHWLMFVYRVLGPVWVEPREMNEGRLDWHPLGALATLPVPESDRDVLWPLIERADGKGTIGHEVGGRRPGFFAVHIDCTGGRMTWAVEEETPPTP
ncbi:MAG: hypothetical protein HBSAPP03_29720 [Phycisphaerae bacterium]|nr:MAG: hypothetical protein HBSAPP03_29720 [Phycisphaerae bacterium]